MLANIRPRYILFAAILLLVHGCVYRSASGQDIDIDDGTVIRGVEGFTGIAPSYLCLVKVETGHSGDSVGSGAFISNRLVLTCQHNVRGVRKGDRVGIHLTNGSTYWATRITKTNPKYDLALIYVDDKVVDYHRILKVQDTIYTLRDVGAMGFKPSKNGLAITFGVPTGRKFGAAGVKGHVYIQHTAQIEQGMSGGPLIDESCMLVGVNVTNGGGATLSVSLHRIHEFLNGYKGPQGDVDDPFDGILSR